MSIDQFAAVCASVLLVLIALVLRYALERPRRSRPKGHVIDFLAWRELQKRRTRTP